MRRIPLVAAAAVALALAGCGDDDDSNGSSGGDAAPAGGGTLEVIAEDIAFGEDAYETSAGTVELVYKNEGAINHTLLIEGVDDFVLEVTSNGDEDSGSVELEPGSYVIYCDVPGHREAGMEATLEVS